MAQALVEVVPDRLLDDEPRERARSPAGGRSARCASCSTVGHEQRRRDGQVVDAVARQAALVLDDVEPRIRAPANRRAVVDATRLTKKSDRGERRPRRLVDRAGARTASTPSCANAR